ncbi:hypothetical protein [Gimibacter soli]|uniref:PAS domain-containing protein n=1 Tax=Gimibacter soli TaxID=3024400 RepID=A0AAF0BLY5_9PROT|nr:hypothetical protein [Gimibacter soli]WCL54752.1 hypothetical protein PH603_03135 [Gimibacter soli]
MPKNLTFRPLDTSSLSVPRRRLWDLWHKHDGAPDLLDILAADKAFAAKCMIFSFEEGNLSASFVGANIKEREATASGLPKDFIEVYVESHRDFIRQMFARMAATPCGSVGFVERRVVSGQTPVRSRYLCLPIVEADKPVTRFVSVDNGVTYAKAADIPAEKALPTGFTRLTDVSLVRVP